ncbi:hypothetical protein P8625_08120 [Tenacibaculum tangerinum]|uniref:Uncharacterized protein n=1 Tax=Tenacibaculum tangerinum TaxID=3038772 RepID=A0ABY8L0B7_9FLAO|nr:hypothetical protein [Tenacibaculum tangerinum]WGH74087.1 hypothetical protein P8625_08120 [Tenacibaculum tangerinum]
MSNQSENKGWLQRLKEESWEAELLVSAIAIYGSFKLFDIIGWTANFFINVLNPSQYYIGYFITFFGLLAISILASMFVIHFFLRAYWVGLVGLNSVFPDYSIEDSAYSKIYTEKILSILPKLKDSIQKVDELCSVIFSVAFTFLLMYGYIAIFSSLYLLLFNLLSEYVNNFILLIPAFLIVGSLILQSIITAISNLKKNKEKEKLQILNFKIVRFVSMVSFGPFYKSILQVSMIFGSNFKKKKSLAYLMLLFLVSGIIVTSVQIQKTNIFYLIISTKHKFFNEHKTYADYYKDDNKSNSFLLAPEIESSKIDSNVLEIFIPIFKYEEKIREEFCGAFEKDSKDSKLVQREKEAVYLSECYKKYHALSIDGEKIAVDFIRYHNHPRTHQKGLLGYVNIKNIADGLHEIKVEKKGQEYNFLEWTIPFYKISKN